MPNIIIIGAPSDPQVKAVARCLKDSLMKVHYLELSAFSDNATVHWSPDTSEGGFILNGNYVPFNRIHSVYWQNANPLNILVSRELMSALSPFFYNKSIRWFNSIEAITYHQNKPRQLAHAKALGATIPDTFIGNDPETAHNFVSTHGDVIVKPVHGGALTRLLTAQERNGADLQQLLSQGPLTLQKHIGGQHIRTFVLGHHVLSARIHSDHLDYRDDLTATATEHHLSRADTELARRICRGFGMAWCAIDWKLQGGKCVFLEANPCPHFAKFEDLTHYPIAGCLVNMLLDYRTVH